MPIDTTGLEHRHLDALRRIYEAEKIWAARGNQPRSFLLLHRGGMRSEVDHPAWDRSWAVPSEHTIDDLAELALLRVDPSTSKARTFVLSMNGRKLGAALTAEALAPPASLPESPAPIPTGQEASAEPVEEATSTVAPSAFVSWAHSGQQWQKTIGDFTVHLRQLGIAADVDLFEAHNPQVNWATYGPNAIERNEFVIIAVNAAYRERWEANNNPHLGSGAAREANVLKGLFNRDQDAFYRKVKIVILPGANTDYVPAELLAAPQRFEIKEISANGLEDLIRTLTGQPAFPRPAVGQIPVLPPKFTDQQPIPIAASKQRATSLRSLGIANPLVSRVLIRQYASPLEHDEPGCVIRVAIAGEGEPSDAELSSATKDRLKEALGRSHLERWAAMHTTSQQANPAADWRQTRPNSGRIATFKRDWGVLEGTGSTLAGKVTLQLPPTLMLGSRVILLVDLVEQTASFGEDLQRLRLPLTDLYSLLHTLSQTAIDDLAATVLPLIYKGLLPPIIGPNYEIQFGDRTLEDLVRIPASFRRPEEAQSLGWANIDTPEDSDAQDVAARRVVLRRGLGSIFRSNEYDHIEDAIANLQARHDQRDG
jgi:hypothetical protein